MSRRHLVDAQSDLDFGQAARSSRTSFGRRLRSSWLWSDGRCARAPVRPPPNPRMPPSPSGASRPCLAALCCAVFVRTGPFGPQVSAALSHDVSFGHVVWVPSLRLRSGSACILSLKPAHCACGCLYSCVSRRGSLVVGAVACLGVCGGLRASKRPPERVNQPL